LKLTVILFLIMMAFQVRADEMVGASDFISPAILKAPTFQFCKSERSKCFNIKANTARVSAIDGIYAFDGGVVEEYQIKNQRTLLKRSTPIVSGYFDPEINRLYFQKTDGVTGLIVLSSGQIL